MLASALLAACPAYATGNYSFKRIDNTFGLSSSNVKCVAEDSYGFIWLGTKNGLHRYDGLDMRRLNCFDHKKKQGNNNIAALYEDERKMMWVGTDRGVYLYNPKTDTFSFIDRKDRRNGKYPDNWVQTIDGDGKGNVWVLLPDLGVFHYHGQSVDYYSVTPIKDNLKEKFPSNICVDDNGDVWVTTASAGIYKFDKRARRFVRVVAADGQDMEGVMFTTVVEDTDGSLIFASTNGYLFRYNPVHNTFSKINFSAEGKIYMRCMQCFEDEIWIGTQHGLYILNKYDNTETVLHEDPLNKFSLSDDIIYCLYESRSGDVWIGTSFGGVNYTSRNKFYFKVFGLWSGLTGRVVNGLTQSADNRIWIGTEDRGLFSLNPSTNIISAINDITAAQKTVLLLTAFNGSVYAGFSRGGLLRVDGSGRVSTVLNIKEKDNSVYSYLKDSRGNEWVGLGYALYRRDAGQKDFRHVNETGYDWIFNLFESHDGTVWIGTMGNGVWRYTPSTGKYKRYVSGETSRSGLRSNSISSFMEDSRGNVWVSTDRGGISRYNKKEDNFTSFGIEEGLPDDVAYNILEDNNGNLWFGTNKGLVKFNPDTRAVRVFTVKDGLPNNQFNYNSAIKANDGLFYFGSIGGIIAFNPDKEDNQTMQSSLYFTQLRILNEEVTVDTKNSPLKENIMFTRRLTLPYDMATFSLRVVSPSFGVTSGSMYSYKLEPVNSEWISMSGNQISFANLPPGTYNLCVKVDTHGQTITKSLEIVITPPWYSSKWAYLAYIILIVAGVMLWFVLYRNHKEKQLRERQHLFAVNKEKELYQNKVNFFTEVAHEIRTPLPLISGISMSMKNTCGRRSASCLSASSAWLHAVMCHLPPEMPVSISRRSCSCRRSSSTISMLILSAVMPSGLCPGFLPAPAGLLSAAAVSSPCMPLPLNSSGSDTWNVVPLPLADSSVMRPPSRVASSRAIDRPRPTPSVPCAPGRRVKALNMRRASSGVIPRPVSATSTCRRLPCMRADMAMLPWSVYLRALLIMLSSICFMRKASPRHRREPHPEVSLSTARPLASACGRMPSAQLSTSCRGLKLTLRVSTLPLSRR